MGAVNMLQYSQSIHTHWVTHVDIPATPMSDANPRTCL